MAKVYPTSKNALNVTHPEGNLKLSVEGSHWPDDGFTARLLTDGDITDDESKAWKGEETQ